MGDWVYGAADAQVDDVEEAIARDVPSTAIARPGKGYAPSVSDLDGLRMDGS